MRRVLSRAAVALALLALSASPALAVKPVGGCPNPQFDQMTYPEFRQLSLDVGVPEELLGPEHEAMFPQFDKNGDGTICVQDKPDNAGHLFGWIFNVIDNTAGQH